jgi:hypothetical protein
VVMMRVLQRQPETRGGLVMIRPPRVPPPSEVITPGGAPPGRPANIRSAQLIACAAQALQDGAVCLQRSGLLDAMRMIVPAVNGIRATEAPWYLGWPIRPRAREDWAG